MRALVLSLTLAGCAAEGEGPVVYRSTLDASTRGLVLHGDGERGHAGMFATNCPFETQRGQVTGDYDLPDEGEEVQDGGESPMGPETVALVLGDRVHLLEKSTGDYLVDEIHWPHVRQVRLFDHGYVGLVRDRDDLCQLEWRTEDGGIATTVELEDGACDGRVDTTDDGEVWLAAGDRVLLVSAEGDVVEVDGGGDQVVWDDEAQRAYVARTGGDAVRAVDLRGATVWTRRVDGGVSALSHAGRHGAAVVSTRRADGSGSLSWLDGVDGTALAHTDTPSAADRVTSSPTGRVVALVRADQVHFYEVGL